MLTFNLPEIGNVNIYIKNKYLLEFTKRQLQNYFVDYIQIDKINNEKYVIIETEINLLKSFNNKNERFSRDCFISNGGIEYQYLRVENIEEKTFISCVRNTTGLHKCCVAAKDFIHRNDYALLHSMFYQYVLFPIFLIYTVFGGYYLLHGSLNVIDNKKILLCGLDGVGKSSLNILLARAGGNIFSDNFILYNGRTVLPLSLPIRNDKDFGAISGIKLNYKNKKLFEYLSEYAPKESIEPDKLFLLSIAEELFLKRDSFDEYKLFLYMNHAPEINEANKFIGPFSVFSYNIAKESKKQIDIFRLGIPKGKLGEGVEVIINEAKKTRG